MKFVLYANGGAAVAILSYLGAVHGDIASSPDMRLSMGFFIAGIVFGGIATFTAYLTQFTLFKEGYESSRYSHAIFLRCSVAMVVLGILCFAAGSFVAVFKFIPVPCAVG